MQQCHLSCLVLNRVYVCDRVAILANVAHAQGSGCSDSPSPAFSRGCKRVTAAVGSFGEVAPGGCRCMPTRPRTLWSTPRWRPSPSRYGTMASGAFSIHCSFSSFSSAVVKAQPHGRPRLSLVVPSLLFLRCANLLLCGRPFQLFMLAECLQAKRIRGMSVGVISTAEIQDATPAAVFAQ